MSLNLEKQLCFYSSYHQHPVNMAIHMLCIPMIVLTFFCVGTLSPTIIPLPSWLTIPNLDLNVGTIFTLIFCGFYILLEPVAGSLVTPLLFSATAYAKHLTTIAPAETTKLALIIHVTSWLCQFVGHGVFERRAPALFENLFLALVLAPFFEWMEFLFLLGYRPELKGRIDKLVEKRTEEFRAKDAAKKEKKNGKAQ